MFSKTRGKTSEHMRELEKIFRNKEFAESPFGQIIIQRIEKLNEDLDSMRDAWNGQDPSQMVEAFNLRQDK
jgi:hypothetical protein